MIENLIIKLRQVYFYKVDLSKMTKKYEEQEKETNHMKTEREKAESKLLDLEARSMRENLRFNGIVE